jgi:hypothetical protein
LQHVLQIIKSEQVSNHLQINWSLFVLDKKSETFSSCLVVQFCGGLVVL